MTIIAEGGATVVSRLLAYPSHVHRWEPLGIVFDLGEGLPHVTGPLIRDVRCAVCKKTTWQRAS